MSPPNPANLYYRDVRQVVGVLLPLWMFLTPVIYPSHLVPAAFRWVVWANPMAGLVEAQRAALLYGAGPDPLLLAPPALFSLGLLALAYPLFKSKEPAFAEVV